ncbi:cation diffusion facilitator family transporter [Erythrobacter sp. LQ02-29]|uniref:cation diffusion facilitator family transporter n=1 Tax=Erythrobacter sp. LQ02-29 TaxID=2920384 RepID=UPI001F4E314E|nr:cation diffusion facilitator family transporter [Erythrobacter sp. LQ02-29]MCP9221788.1 cation diffusion facilitator family transporter [Erythrobacter sp. LQ02-29]
MSERATLARSAAFASIGVAAVLISLKTWATVRTGSAAMMGSLADSSLDLLASMVTLVGVWIAAQPADRDHRFGHGKAEAVAAMIQVLLIAISAAAIAFRSIDDLVSGARVTAATDGIYVSLFAILATLGLLAWQRFVIARTRSVAIRTDFVHYQSDLLLNLAVIAALALDQYAGLSGADPLFGLAIAAWLIWGAYRSGTEAIDHLMDREWDEAKRQRFVAAAAEHHELSNLHDLRTRTAGNRDFVQFHVDMPARMTVGEAHDILEKVEEDLCRRFPDTELLIHIDPRGHVDEPDNPLAEENEFAKLEKRP